MRPSTLQCDPRSAPTSLGKYLGSAIIAKHSLRLRDEAVLKTNATKFPQIETFTVEKLLGGWDKVQKEHFADGGIYDQIAVGQ